MNLSPLKSSGKVSGHKIQVVLKTKPSRNLSVESAGQNATTDDSLALQAYANQNTFNSRNQSHQAGATTTSNKMFYRHI